jgi:ribosome-associated protein
MEADLYINEEITIPGSELIVSTSRSSGPGGQHVNKTSSRVSLRWNVNTSSALNEAQKTIIMRRLKSRLVGEGELLVHVETERSQIRNRALARERLLLLIKEALVPVRKRIATKPTAQAKKRRIENKLKRKELKNLRRIVKWSE